MPSQANIQQTILNGAYALGTLTNNNYTLVTQGQLPIRKSFIQWFRLNLQALEDQFSIGDYISNTTVTLFNRINGFVGIPYGATVDPNFQNPNIIIDVTVPFSPTILVRTQADLIDAGGGNWYLPFLDDNGNPIVNGSSPATVLVNGVSFAFTFDTTFSPSRIFGFANNLTQTIIVTVI